MKTMNTINAGLAVFAVLGLALTGCGKSGSGDEHAHGQDTHTHADGATHTDHAAAAPAEDHAHDETPLGTVTIDDMRVELAQGHGAVVAGKESHLVVKLPYNDGGATIVRAWIGAEDRTLSIVGKGEYATDHDDYDIHAIAPDPMPVNALWWIEIEKPDGTKVVGSAAPIME